MYNVSNNAVLYHHGILGQRWGKQNGPPYPLGSSDHSASEKKAGWRKSLDKSGGKKYTKGRSSAKQQDDSSKEKHGLSDKQKRAIKIGAASAVTVLAAIGAYKLKESGKLDPLIEKGREAVDAMFSKDKAGNSDNIGQWKVNDLPKPEKVAETVGGIKKLAKPETLQETLKNVNTHEGSNKNYKNNCTLCSIATFLRQQGLDVRSGSTGGEMQQLGEKVEECFKGARIFEGSAVKFGRSRQDAAEMLVNKFGNNASGVCSVQWKTGGGHAFNWKIKDGIVSFFDGQDGKNDDHCSNVYWKLMNPNGGLTIARLDNAEINFDGIKELLE